MSTFEMISTNIVTKTLVSISLICVDIMGLLGLHTNTHSINAHTKLYYFYSIWSDLCGKIVEKKFRFSDEDNHYVGIEAFHFSGIVGQRLKNWRKTRKKGRSNNSSDIVIASDNYSVRRS